MKKLLIFWLLSLPALAQYPLTINVSGYRGNVISKTVDLLPADTLLPLSARATFTNSPLSLLISPQPTLSRSGLKLTISFYPTLNLPTSSWIEVSVGTTVRYAGSLVPDKTTVGTSPADASILGSALSQLGIVQSMLPTKLDAAIYNTFVVNYDATISGLNSALGNRVATVDFNTYKQNAAIAEASQNQAIGAKLPNSYSVTQALVDGGQNAQIDLKASSADVYPKSQTYSQAESDTKKPDFEIVSTFAVAQSKTQSGKPKVFILTNDTAYGGSSVVIWSGSSYSVLPAIPRTN